MYMIGARIYMKPLLPEGRVDLDIQKVMESGKRALLRRLRGKLLQQTAFSPAAKKSLAEAIQIKVKASSLQVVSSHPGFLPLIQGQKKQQMTWLTKARAPIPIMLDTGRLIFRNATHASMERGAWWHPGRTPSTYVDRAKQLTREFMRTKMMKETEKHLKMMVAKAGNKVMKTK
jgi:hypothetical protein